MKYDKETTARLLQLLGQNQTPDEIAEALGFPRASIIAKLSSMGLYQKKEYLDKRGQPPVKKAEYIERIAPLLNTTPELLESLEKANKNILFLIEKALLKRDSRIRELENMVDLTWIDP